MACISSEVFIVISTLLVITISTTSSFVVPSSSTTSLVTVVNTRQNSEITRLFSTTLEPDATALKNGKSLTNNSNDADEPMGWECNEDAECVQVPLCDDQECRTTLDVRIHGEWYDLSGWRKAHPAGEHWIDWYDGRDATEVMDAFHSEKARNMYQRLPKTKPETATMLESMTEPDSKTQIAFRELRSQLEKDGWWERDVIHEAKLIGIWASLVIGAAVTATIPAAHPISTILLGISMTQSGWLGHDYVHGVDDFSNRFRYFVALGGGMTPTWWSDKHNKHHALTNEMGVDEDIATDPFLFTWAPDPADDSPLRKIQHLIFFIPFSFLFALWRYDSVKVTVDAIEQKRPDAKTELFCLLAHYAVLLTLFPLKVWVPAVFLSGLLSALIVTPTHQSEEMFEDYQPDWVSAQFESTRNAVTTNPFSEWIWGGMQYQLEHHLFPSMPRSKYPKLKPILQKFATDNNIPGGYRDTDEFSILKMNWQLYKKIAEADAVPGAPRTRGRPGQLGAINESMSPAAGGFVPSS